MGQTKITVKIYEPLLRDFDRQIDSLFLKRDAFLNHMIKGEVRHLANDMKDKQLSSRAKRYIAGELKRLGTVPVNIVVDTLKQLPINWHLLGIRTCNIWLNRQSIRSFQKKTGAM